MLAGLGLHFVEDQRKEGRRSRRQVFSGNRPANVMSPMAMRELLPAPMLYIRSSPAPQSE